MDKGSINKSILDEGAGEMRYRRQEAFRYQFTTPIYCFYSMRYEREKNDGVILDLSPNGLKLETTADLPLVAAVDISFALNSSSLNVIGNIKWKKNYINRYIIGLQLENDRELKQAIINGLKQHVKIEQNK